ncbi:hypothetical protein KUV89_09175 [Marinobacter hydrocarbonoclasticus]|nr:hypothetical protein [Marinobacter nauticus]
MDTALVGIAGTVLGIIVGALLQHFLAIRMERNKKLIEAKSAAYLDFINSVVTTAIDPKKTRESLEVLTQAKMRCALLGNGAVLESMKEFYSKHGVLSSPEARAAFRNLVLAMKEDLSGPNGRSAAKALDVCLFGDE